MISLQENPTLAIRLAPMAELRLYKIAHPAILCDLMTLIALVLVVLIQRKWTNGESWFLVVFASHPQPRSRPSHRLPYEPEGCP